MAFVSRLHDRARDRLIVVADGSPLSDVANLLHAGTDMIVVCNSAGHVSGIITKTDIVACITRQVSLDNDVAATAIMRREVVTCREHDDLREIWELMRVRDLKNLPITDEHGFPTGLLNARDALEILLEETEDADALLRDYVMGVGYR